MENRSISVNMNWKKVTRENRTIEPVLNFDGYHQKTGRVLDFIDQLKGVRTNKKWSTWGRDYIQIPSSVLKKFGIVSNTHMVVYKNFVNCNPYNYCYAGSIFEGDAAWFDEYRDLTKEEILGNSVFQLICDALENANSNKSFKSFFDNSIHKWTEVPVSNLESAAYAKRHNTDVHQIQIEDSSSKEKYLFLDTETTGLPHDNNASYKDLENWPNIVQIAWILTDVKGNVLEQKEALVKPNRFRSFDEGFSIHGISIEEAKEKGKEVIDVLNQLEETMKLSSCVVGHNINFDYNVIAAEMERYGIKSQIHQVEKKCTMVLGRDTCRKPFRSKYKYPSLNELHETLFGEAMDNAHDAMADTMATKNCFWSLKELNAI